MSDDEAFIGFNDPVPSGGGGSSGAPQPLPPWFKEENFDPDDVLTSFHNEILDFCEFMSPRTSEAREVEEVERFMKGLMHEAFPKDRPQLSMFGSQMTGLMLPNSDIDIAINKVPENAIHMMSRTVRKHVNKEITELQVISHARVPIIKFVHKSTGRNVDVSFNMETGSETGKITLDFLEAYPHARPLIMVLKQFLAQRVLHETFHGGIGSFLTTLMVVSMLQHRVRADNAGGRGVTWSLGTLLTHFFRLYGEDFNSVEVGISVRQGGFYFSKREYDMMKHDRPYLLCMENPCETKLDVGQNSYEYHPVIRQAFAYASHRLLRVLGRCKRERREAVAAADLTAASAAAASKNAATLPYSFLAEIIMADAAIKARGAALADGTISGALAPPPAHPETVAIAAAAAAAAVLGDKVAMLERASARAAAAIAAKSGGGGGSSGSQRRREEREDSAYSPRQKPQGQKRDRDQEQRDSWGGGSSGGGGGGDYDDGKRRRVFASPGEVEDRRGRAPHRDDEGGRRGERGPSYSQGRRGHSVASSSRYSDADERRRDRDRY